MKITKELLAKVMHESMYGKDSEFGDCSKWQDPISREYFNLSGAYENNPEKYRKHLEIAAQKALDKISDELSCSDEEHIKIIKEHWKAIKNYIPQSHDMPDVYFALTGIQSNGFLYDYLVVHPESMSSFAVIENSFYDGIDSIFRVYPAIDFHISRKPSDFNLYAKDLLDQKIQDIMPDSMGV